MPNITLENAVSPDIKPLKEGQATLPIELSSDSVRIKNLTAEKGNILTNTIKVGVNSEHKWSDGWNGYDDMIIFTPSDFTGNALSTSGRATKVYHSVVVATGALPTYDVQSGSGSTGSDITGDTNADMVAMAVIPKGFMATGGQCWATAGGGTPPTYQVYYKIIGTNDQATKTFSSAPNVSSADAAFSQDSFDTSGDDGDNNVHFIDATSGMPRIIIMHLVKTDADDQLWGGRIFLTRMA